MKPFHQLSNLKNPILVTGHTGFKGSWLIQMLDILGLQSVGLSLAPLEDSLFLRANLLGTRDEYFLDIRDFEAVSQTIEIIKPSVIIHLAAQPLVSESYNYTRETFEINVMGTVNIFEASRRIPSLKSIAIVTTDKVYENSGISKAFIELDSLGASEPYGASKVGTEAVIMGYKEIFSLLDIPIVTLRSGNILGGGDLGKDRLLPDLVRSHLTSSSFEMRDPSAIRPWQHVLDALFGYLLAIEDSLNSKKSSYFNFGPDYKEIVTAEEVVSIFEEVYDKYPKLKLSKSDKFFHESHSLMLDARKARTDLGWIPLFSGKEAVIRTADWWKVVLSGGSASEQCKNEIKNFFGYLNK